MLTRPSRIGLKLLGHETLWLPKEAWLKCLTLCLPLRALLRVWDSVCPWVANGLNLGIKPSLGITLQQNQRMEVRELWNHCLHSSLWPPHPRRGLRRTRCCGFSSLHTSFLTACVLMPPAQTWGQAQDEHVTVRNDGIRSTLTHMRKSKKTNPRNTWLQSCKA